MRLRKRTGQWRIPLLLAGLIAASSSILTAQSSAATQGNLQTHASPTLDRILLLLKPSGTQVKNLDTLLQAQQTPGNPQFHAWLSASQFADRYSVSAASASAVQTWLTQQGFSVAPMPAGRQWIEFSGTVQQVQQAFGANITSVKDTNGSLRYRLGGSIHLPASISASVEGLVSLDGALATAAATPVHEAGTTMAALQSKAATDTTLLTPARAQSLLQLSGLQKNQVSGQGQTIAIVSRSSVDQSDYAAFRSGFGLPDLPLQINTSAAGKAATISRNGDEAATMLAVSWASIAAPNAQMIVVPAESTNATDGIDLALTAAIDGDIAPTISVGYSNCEAALSAAHQAFYAALYKQAAAEGISVVAASGDSGAAACHSPLDASPISTGMSVNALASTPWNTAVSAIVPGADTDTAAAWQSSNAPGDWFASAGGISSVYASPNWQTASGVPNTDPVTIAQPLASNATTSTKHRYLPDVSLPSAANATSGLTFCLGGATTDGACHLVSAGGSGASAAIFAGISALLNQKYGPQGNLAPNLYALSRHFQNSSTDDTAVPLIDVTQGSAKLACTTASADCVNSQIGFDAAKGYDFASGLGSVNASALVNDWTVTEATGTSPATVEMTNTGGITYNPSAIITLTAKVLSGSGGTVPTGTVQFYDQTVGADTGSPVTLDASGNASYQEDGQFTVGGHNIAAIYSGDSTYASGESQPVTINIQPSPTSLTVAPSTTTPNGGSTITVTGTVTSTNLGNSPPTGTLTVNLDGVSQGTAKLTTTSSVTSGSVNVTVPTAGAHTVQGTYSGDSNYNNSTSPSVTITVAKGATVTSISATPSTLTAGVPETFTATVAPTSASITTYTITGTISFYDGGTTLLGTATISSNTAILTGILLSTTTAHTITAVYSGDTSWTASVSSPLLLEPILLPVTVTLTSSNTVIAPGQSASLTATVTPVTPPISTAEQNPTGNVLFYAGTALLGEVALSNGIADTSVATIYVPSLPAGSYVVTAQYAGDATYGPATSNSLGFSVENFTVSCATNNVTVVQGQTASVTCNVASLGGLTGPIQVACAEQNPAQQGAIACSFNPTIIQGTGQTTLTIVTTAGDTSTTSRNERPRLPGARGPSHSPTPPLLPWASGTALAFAGLFFTPIGRRSRLFRNGRSKLLGLVLLFAGVCGAGLGCNNTSSLSTQLGTSLGVHTLKISAAAYVNTVTVTQNTYVTVDVTPGN
ncbi:Ig-like domain repeat protein [Acidicapsa dinghuensis]|uniref:Ig-like domain repeat protein n=1 Tax=Acidicapsa dinghuensis TaxID=2218256 RepID=A0ABW1EB48_9BACT|nr:Ig-like domain repeat protein [Acidicapsa dinghuensis]